VKSDLVTARGVSQAERMSGWDATRPGWLGKITLPDFAETDVSFALSSPSQAIERQTIEQTCSAMFPTDDRL
jgi:hypothetical protein